MVVPPLVGELKKHVNFFTRSADLRFGSSKYRVSTRYLDDPAVWK